ncbi:MAG: Autotransporter translocation and assembly factor TamB [uncultured Thiotrichaceae bacterium]|uniref:Autotransporter translocation and assembly factor TamB n=1 Tax=uncultured Thiotrichaceae bacterium TaxID=298394 RepID=A0A6S6TWP5_9GAMM|nr:MAG: Autotransporter translocation and assembly factor TamB [uncultured Thiotrichaceae bacterium]
MSGWTGKRLTLWLLSPFAILLFFIVLLLSLLFYFSSTTSGTAMLIKIASNNVPSLEIEGAEGTLLKDLLVKKITWAKDGMDIEIIDAALDISSLPPGLTIDNLVAQEIKLILPEKEQSERTPLQITLPEIHVPLDVDLKNVLVKQLSIYQGGAIFTLRDVNLSASVVKDNLYLHNLSGDLYDDAGNIDVKARGDLALYAPHPLDIHVAIKADSTKVGVGNLDIHAVGEVTDYDLSANGVWKYGEYPEYKVKLAAKGNLEHLDAQTNLDGSAGDAQLTGKLKWAPELHWDLDLTGDRLNPGVFAADYSGDLNMVWKTTGSLTDKIRMQAELKSLTGKVQDYPVAANLQITLEDQAITLQSLNAQVGDNTLTASGEAKESLEVNWQLDASNLGQLHNAIEGNLKGNGRLQGQRDAQQITLSITELKGKVLDYKVSASGNVTREQELLSADNLIVNVGDNRIKLNGSADEQQGMTWDLNAKKLQQLMPKNPETLTGNLKGNGIIKGLLDGSKASLQIETLTGKLLDYPIKANGFVQLEDKTISTSPLSLEIGSNKLHLTGNTDTATGMQWKVDAPKLKQLHPEVNGNLKGNGELSAELDGSAYSVNIKNLKGKLEGRPLSISGKVISQAGKLEVADLKVDAGVNYLFANGTASEPFDIKLNIDAPKLSQVLPDLSGSLKGNVALAGKFEALNIKADVKGKKLRYQQLRIGSLDLAADQKGDFYTVKAAINNIEQEKNKIQSLKLDGEGKITQHTVKMALVHEEGKVDLQANGGWENEQWQGQLQKLLLRDTQAGNWTLNNKINILASAKAARASQFCLNSTQKAQLCVEGAWSKEQGTNAKGSLNRIPLAMAKPWLPKNIGVAGLVNADFDIRQSANGQLNGKVTVKLPDNQVTVKDKRGKVEVLKYSNSSADIIIQGQKADLKARLDIVNRAKLKADVRVDLIQPQDRSRLNGNIEIAIPDIGWLQKFSNDIDRLKGNIDGKFAISGTLAKPRLTGAAQLKNGSLTLPETGANLQAINLTLQANRADRMDINGSLKAGEGVLQAKGQVLFGKLPQWQADVSLKGDRLLLMNTHEVQSYISPDLVIKAKPESVKLTGKVLIPETTVTLRELPVTAKKRSDDIIIIGRDVPAKQQAQVVQKTKGNAKEVPLDIQPNVQVVLGDKITFTGFGLSARLKGSLRVLRTRQDIVAQGTLNILDGIYKAYGQDLEIERGRLIFNGPIDTPGLDVRAVRTVSGDIKVGIALRGTVQNPESELFSEPAQSQTDTLSYLLTGKAASSLGSGDSALLSSAITTLGVKGGENIAQQIGGSIGLDEVGIDAKDGDYKNSELTLGKKLGPKLYIKYIVGLFDSLQKVAITYQINDRVELNARTGVQQEVDINYKFDTNRGLFGR